MFSLNANFQVPGSVTGSGTASLSRGSPSLNFLAFFDGGILARFHAIFWITHLFTTNDNPNNKTESLVN